LDISPSALEQARRFALAGVETYELADLFDLPADCIGRFDWIFEHTCFCAIDPRQRPEYVRVVTGALRPAGSLLAIFFLNPRGPSEAPEEGGPPFGVSRDELAQLFTAHFELVEELRPSAAYPGREGREVIWLLSKSR
jgi:hypothetical protein